MKKIYLIALSVFLYCFSVTAQDGPTDASTCANFVGNGTDWSFNVYDATPVFGPGVGVDLFVDPGVEVNANYYGLIFTLDDGSGCGAASFFLQANTDPPGDQVIACAGGGTTGDANIFVLSGFFECELFCVGSTQGFEVIFWADDDPVITNDPALDTDGDGFNDATWDGATFDVLDGPYSTTADMDAISFGDASIDSYTDGCADVVFQVTEVSCVDNGDGACGGTIDYSYTIDAYCESVANPNGLADQYPFAGSFTVTDCAGETNFVAGGCFVTDAATVVGSIPISAACCDGAGVTVELSVGADFDGSGALEAGEVPNFPDPGNQIASCVTAESCANCAVASCPDFNAISYGPACNGYSICIGYVDADMDGIGDSGEDPTGTTMTVATGLATSTAQPPIDNSIMPFDSSNDGVDMVDAIGFCLTVLFDNPACDPEPYTPLVTLLCPDGTPATYMGNEVTDFDILAFFGVPGGTSIYPPLVGIITAPVCPFFTDGTGAVAGNVELFVADAMGNPTAASCLVVEGPVPACDTDNTADPAANAIPIQFNDNDDLLTAAGAPPFACGIDAVADLSSACGACNDPPTCPNFNVVSYGFECNGYSICIGYADADADGTGDNGEDPTGTTMTVTDGLATSTPQAPITDGIIPFDSTNDGVDMIDAIGYCLTVLFDIPTCEPEPYTPMVTLLCPDGTPATLNGVEVTNYDILANDFGVAGGTAIYPPVVGIITAPVCPFFSDGTGAVAGNVEVFIADAMGNPTATSCLVVEGPLPACDTDNTANPAANEILIQFNDNVDPLLIAAGAPAFTCGIDAVADLSSACGACAASVCSGDPDYSAPSEVCSSVAGASNYTLTPGAGCTNPISTQFPANDRYDYFITIYIDPATGAPANAPAGYDPVTATNTFAPDLANVLSGTLGGDIGFDAGTQCATPVGLVLTNIACEPAFFSFFIVPVDYDSDLDGDAMFGDVLDDADPAYCPPIRYDVTIYPNLTVTTTPSADCTTVTATIMSDGDTDCTPADGTEMMTCSVDGDLNFDFSAAFADPLGCSTLTATAACSGCDAAPVPGCTDPCDPAFNPASTDDTLCEGYDMTCNADCTAGPFGGMWDAATCACIDETVPVNGCTDAAADNFDPAANCDDGSCVGGVPGCTDPCDPAFDPASTDDTLCQGYDDTCNDDCTIGPFGGTWDAATCACIDETAPVDGCTDDTADNYDPAANCDDGSCTSAGVCNITVTITNTGCTDPNDTPEDTSDDVTTYSVTVTDVGGTGTTWAGTIGTTPLTGQAYGVPYTGSFLGLGSIPVMVNEEGGTMCTATTDDLIVSGCGMTNIPTLSQWGLMILALLMMTFGALRIGSVSLSSSRKK